MKQRNALMNRRGALGIILLGAVLAGVLFYLAYLALLRGNLNGAGVFAFSGIVCLYIALT